MPFIYSEKHVQEKDFLSLVCFCIYYWILMKSFRTFGEVFSLQVCQTSFLHIEDFSPVKTVYYCKFVSTIFFDLFVITFWQAHENFIFWNPVEDSGETSFFEKLVFAKFLWDLSRELLGVCPENWGQLC